MPLTCEVTITKQYTCIYRPSMRHDRLICRIRGIYHRRTDQVRAAIGAPPWIMPRRRNNRLRFNHPPIPPRSPEALVPQLRLFDRLDPASRGTAGRLRHLLLRPDALHKRRNVLLIKPAIPVEVSDRQPTHSAGL